MITDLFLKDRIKKNAEKYWIFVYLAVTIANLILRFWSIPGEGIYGDSPCSIFYSQQSIKDMVAILSTDRNPPLYFIILHFWIKIFGLNSIYLKALSALISTGTAILLLYFASKYLNKLSGIMVSMLYISSNWWMVMSHELRSFALVGFLTVLSFHLFLQMIQRKQPSTIIGLAITNVLLLYSHYITVFIPLVQLIVILAFVKDNKKGLKYFIISQLIASVLYLPWAGIVISNIPDPATFWLQKPTAVEFIWVFEQLSGSIFLLKAHIVIIGLFLMLLLFNKRIKIFNISPNPLIILMLVLWYVLPVIVDFLIAQFTPVFRLQYVLYSSLGLFLLISYIISIINIHFLFRIILMIVLVYFPLKNFSPYQPIWEAWNTHVPEVKKMKDQKTMVIICPNWKYIDFSYYYNIDYFKDYNHTPERLSSENIGLYMDSTGLKPEYYAPFNRVIFIRGPYESFDPKNTIGQHILKNDFNLCRKFGENSLFIEVYCREGTN